jgi:hypothetical protein
LLKYPPKWPWPLASLALLALYHLRNNSYDSQTKMCKTLTLGLLPHLIQLQHEYKKLVEDFNCDIQEFITVQDPPAPPSNILHLPPLTSLHSATTRNMELPQQGEPRKVQPPSQRTLSRQLMRAWPLWKTNIDTASNTRISTRMLDQLALRTPKTFQNFPRDK